VTVVNGDGGNAHLQKTLSIFDVLAACFYDFFESGANQWERDGEWAIAALPGGERAMTDSPAGTYNNAIPPALTTTTTITSQPFDLDGCSQPLLTFRHDYVIASIEGSQDVAQVEISEDDGVTWMALGSYTGGGIFGNQVLRGPDEDGAEWTEVNWRTAELGLAAYSGTVRLRFALEVDRDISDKGWVLDEVMVITGAVRTTDLQLDLSREGNDEVLAGEAITYSVIITNAGPDALDSLVSGLYPAEAVASVESSATCWADEAVLCHFDELTGTQNITMVLRTSRVYSGVLTTTAAISGTYPYLTETNLSNNRRSIQVQVIGPAGAVYLPLILKN